MNMMVKHALRDTRIQLVMGLLTFVVVAALSWFLYSSYRNRVNEQAQFAFSLQLENLERMRQDKAVDKQMWESAAQGLAQVYQEHASSDLAPFYMTSEADALLQAGKTAEAIQLLEKALQAMGSSNPLYYLYKIKLQVIRLGSDDAAIREEGHRELKTLAEDVHNPHRGYAWYQLWHQAWVTGDEAGVEEALAKLSAYQGQGGQWGQLAQAKMEFSA